MKYKIITLCILLNFILLNCFAQLDNNYFNLNLVNPAFVGSKEKLSVGLDYQLQFVDLNFIEFEAIDGAPKTFIFNIYTPITTKFGVGFSYINDKVGPLKQNVINADFSYRFNVNETSEFAFGIKTGIRTINASLGELLSPDGQTGIDPLLENNDNTTSKINLGLGVYYILNKKTNNEFAFGLSTPNLLVGDFLNENEPINIITTVNYKTMLSEKITFNPLAFLIVPSKSNEKTKFYLAANFEMDKVLGIGFNYQRNIFGIQISSPKIAKIFKIGFTIEFIDSALGSFENNIDFFGNFDFNLKPPKKGGRFF